MSVENPPTYNFNGINFNPSFYTNNNTITKEEAANEYLKNPINNSSGVVNNVLTLTNTSPIQTSWSSASASVNDYVRYSPTTFEISRILSGVPTVISSLTINTALGRNTLQRFSLPANCSTAPAGAVLSILAASALVPSTQWVTLPTINDYTNYNNSNKTLISNVSGTPTTVTELALSNGIGSSLTHKFRLPTIAPQFTGLTLRVSSLSPLQTEWEIPQAITPYLSYDGANLIENTALGSSNITILVVSNSITSANVVSPKFNTSSGSTPLDLCDLQQSGVANLFCNSTRSGNINISTTSTTAHNINIGNLSTNNQGITINSKYIILGSQTATSVITLNCPINPVYLSNPVNIYSLGGVKEINTTATNVQSGTPTSLATFSAQLGVYQVFYQIKYTITVSSIAFTQQRVCLCNTINSNNTVYNQMETLENQSISRPLGEYIITGGGVWINNVTAILSPIFLNVNNTFTAGPTLTADAYLRIVRIG